MVWVRMRDDRAVECCWGEGLWAPRVSLPGKTALGDKVTRAGIKPYATHATKYLILQYSPVPTGKEKHLGTKHTSTSDTN